MTRRKTVAISFGTLYNTVKQYTPSYRKPSKKFAESGNTFPFAAYILSTLPKHYYLIKGECPVKKQTIIIVILCVLVAAVIALSVLGVIGPQGSFAGSSYGEAVPTVTPVNTDPSFGTNWDNTESTMP